MKKSMHLMLGTCLFLVITVNSMAEDTKTNEVLRLAVDLKDGTHLIGVPSIKSVPVQTSFAKFEIPLNRIACITYDAEHETTSVDLRNGDKLKGTLALLKSIQLKTLFGTVTIPLEQVKRIVVNMHGALPAMLKKGLVLHYSFQMKGDRIVDESGNGHEGKVVGAKPAADRFGKPKNAYAFNGRSDYIIIDDPKNDLAFDVNTDSYSISCWAKPSELPNKYCYLIHDRGVQGSGAKASSYSLLYHGSTRRFVAQIWDRSTAIEVQSKTIPEIGKWYHLVMVCDTREVKLYVNGRREKGPRLANNSNDLIPPNYGSTRNRLRKRVIGSTDGGDTHFFPGTMDDIRIYTRALTEDEILRLYREKR